jgi:hypothetical protein
VSARIVYISSAVRSGSTLLDHLLASHTRITSVGEVLHIRSYALESRRDYDPVHPLICTCGQPVPACPFWQETERRLGRPLHSLRLGPRLLYGRSPAFEPITKRLAHAIQLQPSLYRLPPVHAALGGPRLGADSIALFDAIADVSGADYVLDSSKMPYRFWSLNQTRPGSVWLIKLCRDYRAVAYSISKRSKLERLPALLLGMQVWRKHLREMDQLSRDFPASRVITVRYEDLCADPEHTMRTLSDFLGLDFQPEMLTRGTGALHHIGGSPSKFSNQRKTISLDTDYLDRLSATELQALEKLAGPEAARWGYDGATMGKQGSRLP